METLIVLIHGRYSYSCERATGSLERMAVSMERYFPACFSVIAINGRKSNLKLVTLAGRRRSGLPLEHDAPRTWYSYSR